jgi:hypothetical protein
MRRNSSSIKRKLVAVAPTATPPRYTGLSRWPITAVSTSPSSGTVILEKIMGAQGATALYRQR